MFRVTALTSNTEEEEEVLNADAPIPELPFGCKRVEQSFDYLEMIEDEAYQEDAIHAALEDGLIDYPMAYRLRMGDDV